MFSPLLIKISPSLTGKLVVSVLAALAVTGMAASALSVLLLVLLSLILLVLFWLNWKRYLSLRHPDSIIAVHWVADTRAVDLQLASGKWVTVTRIAGRVNTPFMLAAELYSDDRRTPYKLVIWNDSVNRDTFRRLKVILRYAPSPSSATHS